MAKINQNAVKAIIRGDKTSATVGNNRTLTRTSEGLVGMLHGHPVATFTETSDSEGRLIQITLDPCGYETTTTRQAMQDFVEAITGVRCGVSFAKGEFTARFFGIERKAHDNDGKISMNIAGGLST